jgi:PPOX class probable F420-dependent enzyme
MTLDQDVVRLAQGTNPATIVTLMPGGQPHAQLRWVDTDDETLRFNTTPQRQVIKNIAHDPRITVHIHAADNVYDWAEIRGTVAETVSGEPARSHIDILARKYTGADFRLPIGPEGRVMIRIAPQRIVTPAILAGHARHPERTT